MNGNNCFKKNNIKKFDLILLLMSTYYNIELETIWLEILPFGNNNQEYHEQNQY